jgi:YHS domain-containing protein
MHTQKLQSLWLALLAVSLLTLGCNKQTAAEKQAADKQAAEKKLTDEKSGAKVDPVEAAFAELTPEGAAAARKQAICPVGGGPLGTMGKPYKVTIEGRDVYLCCEHCEGDLKADPKKYLAKLKE